MELGHKNFKILRRLKCQTSLKKLLHRKCKKEQIEVQEKMMLTKDRIISISQKKENWTKMNINTNYSLNLIFSNFLIKELINNTQKKKKTDIQL